MRKSYSGNSEATTLAESITTGATGFTTVAATNYPTGVNGPFVVTIGRDTPSEEKLLCSSRTGNIFVVQQRGWDGTNVQAHALGDTVEHTIDADSFDDFADHIYDLTRNDHTQYLLKAGGTVTGAFVTDRGVIPAGSQATVEDLVSKASLTSGGDLMEFVVRHRRGGVDTLADARIDLIRRDNSATSGFPQLTFASDEILVANVRLRMTTSPIMLIDGTVAAPALTFTNDPDTGIYRPATDGDMRFVSNGVQIFRIQTSGLVMQNGQLYVVPGTLTAPGLTFNNDTDSGFYETQGDEIRMALGGAMRYRFHVNEFSGGGDNARDLGWSGERWKALFAYTVNYITLTNGSDYRLKTNIQDSELGLDFINLLRPVSFERINENVDGIHYGLIAQEVEQALGGREFAGLQLPNDSNEYYGLDYMQFVAPLIKGEQQLYEYIKRLEQRIEELENA